MSNFADLTLAWYNSPHFIDMTDRQRAMLITIYSGACHPGVRELAAFLRVAKPVITRAANALEANGLLIRAVVEEDKRRITLSTTPKGQATFAAMREIGES